MMDVIRAINARRSVRKYSADPVSPSDAMTLITAGKFIPRAGGIDSLLIDSVATNIQRSKLSGQECVINAPALIYIAAMNYKNDRYGNRGIRYTFMEAGHAAQNICLMAVCLDLVTVCIGSFKDLQVKDALAIKADPLYLICVGHPDV